VRRAPRTVRLDRMTDAGPGRRFAERSATFIGAVSMTGRLLERLAAFGQILLIAAILGASTTSDLYFVASIVPLAIGTILGDSLYLSILPMVAAEREEGDVEALFSAGLWLSLAVLALATAAYLALLAVVVPIAEPAGSASLGPWLAFAPIGILLGLASYCSAALLYWERYTWPPFRSAAAAVVALALTAVALALGGGVGWLGLAVSTGYGSALLLLTVELAAIGRLGIFASPQARALRRVARLWRRYSTSVAGALVGGQLFVLIERLLAAPLGVGAVSAISYARGVAFTPTVLSQSVALGIYPGMLRAYAADERAYARHALVNGLRLTLFIAFVSASYLAIYARWVTSMLFEWGAMSATSLQEVRSSLAVFALGLVGSMLMIFTARLFSAVAYFRGIVVSQLFALAVYVVAAPLLRPVYGPPGLALAFGIAEVVGASLAVALVARRLGVRPRALVSNAVAPALARSSVVAAALLLVEVSTAELGPRALVVAISGAAAAGGISISVLWRAPWPELNSARGAVRRLGRQLARSA
jgi:putative peptidoglycan lipid II flippase